MIFQQYRSIRELCKQVLPTELNPEHTTGHLRRLLLLLFCLNLVAPAIAQSPDQLRSLAAGSFESQHYREAARYYGRLLELYPRDPKYQYYTAVSLIRSGTGFKRAVELLAQPQVPVLYPDAPFQAGEAYRLAFRFHEADGQYANILSNKNIDKSVRESAGKARKMNTEARLRSGRIYELTVYEYADLSSSPVTISSIKTGNLFRWEGPSLSYLEQYKLSADSFARMQDISAVPVGEPVYFPARTGKKEDMNLYRARKTGEKSLGVPILLDFVLNSKEDEGFAWFDAVDSILYFSSRGHSSMGGYDLFASRMTEGGNGWSKPEALGFPLNSCFDELGLVILPDRKSAVFITNRMNGGNSLTSIIIKWPLELASREETNPDSLLAIVSQVHTVPWPAEAGSRIKTGSKTTETSRQEASLKTEENLPTMPGEDDSDYMQLLNEALKLQLRADSLLRATEAARTSLASTTDPSERQRLQQEIKRNTTLSDQVQGQANTHYSRAREMELRYLQQVYPGGKSGSLPNHNEVKAGGSLPVRSGAEAGGSGNGSGSSSSSSSGSGSGSGSNSSSSSNSMKNTGVKTEKTAEEGNGAITNGKAAVIDSFAILAVCPYDERHPVPELYSALDGVVYRIQLGVFSKPISFDRFRGISPLMFEKVPENGLTRYYAGQFTTIIEAEKALQRVKEYGFREAYLVSFFQGKKISLIRARELEQMIRSSN